MPRAVYVASFALPAAPALSPPAPARLRHEYGASSSHTSCCIDASSHLMPALKYELLSFISASHLSSAQQIASGSVQAIRIRAAREPRESWSKARCIPCARSPDIKMLVPQHALGCRMDARERAPSPRHGAVTAALLRARALHGCARRRRKTVPSRAPCYAPARCTRARLVAAKPRTRAQASNAAHK